MVQSSNTPKINGLKFWKHEEFKILELYIVYCCILFKVGFHPDISVGVFGTSEKTHAETFDKTVDSIEAAGSCLASEFGRNKR